MKKNKKQFKKKKGFSIIEVLVALFVLSFGIMSAIFLMAGSMKDTMEARDLLVASMLSQEGTELVRNIRDNNVTEIKDEDTGVRNSPFDGFSDESCIVDYNYHVDTNDIDGSGLDYFNSKLDCSSSDFQLYFNDKIINGSTVKFYSHSNGDTTKFKRKIILDEEVKDNIFSVTSMVVWDGIDFPDTIADCNIGNKCVYSETILTSWIHFE